MEAGDLLVEVLGEDVDLVLVAALVLPELDLRERLVGEGVRHDEARVAGGAAEVDEAALGEHEDARGRPGSCTCRPGA